MKIQVEWQARKARKTLLLLFLNQQTFGQAIAQKYDGEFVVQGKGQMMVNGGVAWGGTWEQFPISQSGPISKLWAMFNWNYFKRTRRPSWAMAKKAKMQKGPGET